MLVQEEFHEILDRYRFLDSKTNSNTAERARRASAEIVTAGRKVNKKAPNQCEDNKSEKHDRMELPSGRAILVWRDP